MTAATLEITRQATLELRPLTAADAPALQDYLVHRLDAAARRCRFHASVNPRSAALLQRLVALRPGRDFAFVAVLKHDDGDTLVGEARLAVLEPGVAEFALSVAGTQQGRGLAQRLLQQLRETAAQAGVQRLVGDVLEDNGRMVAFIQRQGFTPSVDDGGADACEAGVQRWTTCLPGRPAGRTAPADATTRAAGARWAALRGWLQRQGAALVPAR